MLEARWGTSGVFARRWAIAAGAVILAMAGGFWLYARTGSGGDDAIAKLAAEGNFKALETIVHSDNDAQAMRAASALGTLARNPQTTPILLALLKDPRPPIRERIVLAVAKTPAPKQHAKDVIDLLRNDQSPPVRAAAAETLGQMKAMNAVPFLADALSDENIVYDRSSRALINIMGVIPGFAEKDSPARRKKMAEYYRIFHKNYGRAIEGWQTLNEQSQATQPKKP
ncbi:MAG: HEAT repeat domain-containing protein [Planctomycetaceae bacterium]|nr:HEAT repeat domain-containing protein [Planctomycetaceae bacterium]